MPTFDSDKPMNVLGVNGRLTHRTTKPDQKPGLWCNQRWISEPRPIKGYDPGATIRAELRFDDECNNGHNTFGITGEIRGPSHKHPRNGAPLQGREIAGGCLHEDIASVFPELAPLIKWHLCSTDGPMHYLANAVYLAGDRDHYGLRKGEERPLSTRDGAPMWELVAVNSLGVALSPTPTGMEYRNENRVPLFILEKNWTGENPPVVPTLEWRRSTRVGEGKDRELDAARRCAVWSEATGAELCAEPTELRATLTARLPGLITEFRADMERAGFIWSPDWFVSGE